eukprot:358645-Chlamydomonas_euryale.AAC.3
MHSSPTALEEREGGADGAGRVRGGCADGAGRVRGGCADGAGRVRGGALTALEECEGGALTELEECEGELEECEGGADGAGRVRGGCGRGTALRRRAVQCVTFAAGTMVCAQNASKLCELGCGCGTCGGAGGVGRDRHVSPWVNPLWSAALHCKRPTAGTVIPAASSVFVVESVPSFLAYPGTQLGVLVVGPLTMPGWARRGDYGEAGLWVKLMDKDRIVDEARSVSQTVRLRVHPPGPRRTCGPPEPAGPKRAGR